MSLPFLTILIGLILLPLLLLLLLGLQQLLLLLLGLLLLLLDLLLLLLLLGLLLLSGLILLLLLSLLIPPPQPPAHNLNNYIRIPLYRLFQLFVSYVISALPEYYVKRYFTMLIASHDCRRLAISQTFV